MKTEEIKVTKFVFDIAWNEERCIREIPIGSPFAEVDITVGCKDSQELRRLIYKYDILTFEGPRGEMSTRSTQYVTIWAIKKTNL